MNIMSYILFAVTLIELVFIIILLLKKEKRLNKTIDDYVIRFWQMRKLILMILIKRLQEMVIILLYILLKHLHFIIRENVRNVLIYY